MDFKLVIMKTFRMLLILMLFSLNHDMFVFSCVIPNYNDSSAILASFGNDVKTQNISTNGLKMVLVFSNEPICNGNPDNGIPNNGVQVNGVSMNGKQMAGWSIGEQNSMLMNGQNGKLINGENGWLINGQNGLPNNVEKGKLINVHIDKVITGEDGMPINGQNGWEINRQNGNLVRGQSGMLISGQNGIPVNGQNGWLINGQNGIGVNGVSSFHQSVYEYNETPNEISIVSGNIPRRPYKTMTWYEYNKPGLVISYVKTCTSTFISLGDNNYYYFSNIRATWQEALDACRCCGAELAHPMDFYANSLLVDYLDKHYNEYQTWWWLGGTDLSREGIWTWSHDRSPITFADWSESQPDNAWEGGEHCLHYWKVPNWQWNDAACSYYNRFICQR